VSGINNVVVELIEILIRSIVVDMFFFELLFLKGKENIKK
jgi:hypothetical protein